MNRITGFVKVSLGLLMNEVGEEQVKLILSDFSCLVNPDIENFLRFKAIEFEKQGLSKTQLIFTSYKENNVLIGYYTLATKTFNITKAALSKTLKKRIGKYATYDSNLKVHFLPAPLIAQLGKNFNNGYNQLISGDELLKMACEDIRLVQSLIGGKVAYLECEDRQKLIEFYESNGFVAFAQRELDRDETDIHGNYLIQMLKIFKD